MQFRIEIAAIAAAAALVSGFAAGRLASPAPACSAAVQQESAAQPSAPTKPTPTMRVRRSLTTAV
jgi:hypothetical protein